MECPHCTGIVEIIAINCGIFRHGIYKNGEQIPPHLPKIECDRLARLDMIYGCGKPFKYENEKLVACDYI